MKKLRSRHTRYDFQFARVRLGGEEFGIDLKRIKEIAMRFELRGVAGAAPFVEGVVTLRGLDVPVIDLRKRFFLNGSFEPGRMLIAQLNGHVAGLLVDEIKDIKSGCREVMIRPGSAQNRWNGCVEAVVECAEKSIYIIDLDRVFTEREIKAIYGPTSGNGDGEAW